MLYAIAAVLVLILDQGLKYYVTLNIDLNTGVMPLIPKVLSLVNIHNTGAAFSMLSGGSMAVRVGFVIIALGFTGAVIYALAARKIKSPAMRWLLVLIAAGALGNAIDRALYGYVVDMFHIDLSFLSWFAVFNVADVFISIGGILLCILLILPEKGGEKPEKRTEKEPSKVVLRSKKRPVAPEVRARRESGKLYDDPKPYDRADPFAEFAGRPTAAEEPEPQPAPREETARVPDKKDLSVEQQLAGLTVDDILKELQ